MKKIIELTNSVSPRLRVVAAGRRADFYLRRAFCRQVRPLQLPHRIKFSAIVLAATLVLSNAAGAADSLKIEPAHALPDYTKLFLAGDTFSRRFGNAFAAGDFNKDGRVDLVTHIHGPDPNDRQFAARVYLQDASSAFAEKSEYPLPNVGVLTWAFETADFNGDGHLDVIMDDIGNDLVLMLGNGDGTFKPTTFLGLSASGFFAVADLNGDKHLDLVAGNLDGTVGVFTGAGDGRFTLKATLATHVIPAFPPRGQIMIGDLNGDGKPDIAVASVPDIDTDTGNLDVFLGSGDGTFQEVIRTPNVAVLWGALGDFNSDGILDFAGDRRSPKQLEIWLGKGDGHFNKNKVYSPSLNVPVGIKVADLNYDGIPDVIVSGESSSTVFQAPLSIFLGKGDGSFQAPKSFSPVSNYQFGNSGLVLIDLDGDGLLDMVGLAEDPAALQEEILASALSKGVKRDPTIGFLLSVQNSTPTATGSVVLEATTNLVNWTALATNAASVASWPLVDTSASGQPQRFYRTRRQ